MKLPRRDKALQRLMLPERARAAKSARVERAIPWEDLQYVIQGLTFGPRPVLAAMNDINQRHGLGPHGALILSLLDNGMAYPADLALTLKVSRSTITKELAQLVASGLVSTAPDPRDKRRLELRLTPEGQEASEAARENTRTILQRNLGHYSDEQIRLFADMLADARHLAGTESED